MKEAIKPKFHKGKYGKKYDSYSCGNCGVTAFENEKYCFRCGYPIWWNDEYRTLTNKYRHLKPHKKDKQLINIWLCGACDNEIYDGITSDYCIACGAKILWKSIRCLTE